jgi:hypothetical protein
MRLRLYLPFNGITQQSEINSTGAGAPPSPALHPLPPTLSCPLLFHSLPPPSPQSSSPPSFQTVPFCLALFFLSLLLPPQHLPFQNRPSPHKFSPITHPGCSPVNKITTTTIATPSSTIKSASAFASLPPNPSLSSATRNAHRSSISMLAPPIVAGKTQKRRYRRSVKLSTLRIRVGSRLKHRAKFSPRHKTPPWTRLASPGRRSKYSHPCSVADPSSPATSARPRPPQREREQVARDEAGCDEPCAQLRSRLGVDINAEKHKYNPCET